MILILHEKIPKVKQEEEFLAQKEKSNPALVYILVSFETNPKVHVISIHTLSQVGRRTGRSGARWRWRVRGGGVGRHLKI